MDIPEKDELTEALVEAAVPCIRNFFAEHADETFYGFAVELLAEEGYFHICANSLEAFQPTLESYLESGEPKDEILGDGIKWNNQEWEYFDFNSNCEIWNALWASTHRKISTYKNALWSLPDGQMEGASRDFQDVFKEAGEEAFAVLMTLDLLSDVRKTDDFRAFVFEHHDVF